MSSAADPIVVTEPMSSAATDTLSTETTVTTEPISSGTDATVPADANTCPTEPVTSALAFTSWTTDKSIVGAMNEQCYRIFGEFYSKIVEGGTNTITKNRYDVIVQNLRQCRAGGSRSEKES